MGCYYKGVIQAKKKLKKISKSNPAVRIVWSHNPGSASKCAVLSFLFNLISQFIRSLLYNTQIQLKKIYQYTILYQEKLYETSTLSASSVG